MDRFGVIVFGGGPAGCAAAIRLASCGRRVLLVERSGYEHWRVGETLPPPVAVPLGELDVWDRFRADGHIPSHAIHSAWGSPEPYANDFIFNAYGSGWHIDRLKFDSMLARRVEETGVVVMRRTRVVSVSRGNGCWVVHLQGNGLPSCVQACFLVDATGRSGALARSLGASRQFYDQLVGIVGILEPEPERPVTAPVLLLEAAQEGWWYSAPLPGGALLAAYMTDVDFLIRSGLSRKVFWQVHLGRTVHTQERTRGYEPPSAVRLRAAGTSRLHAPAGPGWIAAGDAAAVYDPLSANGIYKALRQGSHAATIADQYLHGNEIALAEYAASVTKEFENYLKQRSVYYRQETRWPRWPFWRRRQ
jgi:flavin-dependent dehydrogenase